MSIKWSCLLKKISFNLFFSWDSKRSSNTYYMIGRAYKKKSQLELSCYNFNFSESRIDGIWQRWDTFTLLLPSIIYVQIQVFFVLFCTFLYFECLKFLTISSVKLKHRQSTHTISLNVLIFFAKQAWSRSKQLPK